MGGLTQAGGGCLCPENSLLMAAVAAVGRDDADVVLMDTQAGVEHFGRALARGFDQAVVVTDATSNAVSVAVRTARLAAELGIPRIDLVVNRVRTPTDPDRVTGSSPSEGGFPFAAVRAVPWDDSVLDADPSVEPLLHAPDPVSSRGHGRARRRLARSSDGGGAMKTVIIGTGPAGITAAETLRRHDPDAELVLLTTEHLAALLAPRDGRPLPHRGREPLFWKGEDVAEPGSARQSCEGSTSPTSPGSPRGDAVGTVAACGYDSLVLASGSRLHAPMPGIDLPGIHDFKSLDAAERIVADVRAGEVRSVLIVGCGFIGVELGLLLSDLGAAVTVLGRRGWVMPRMLDPQTAAVAERAIRERGVDLRLGVAASAFVGDDVGRRRARWPTAPS